MVHKEEGDVRGGEVGDVAAALQGVDVELPGGRGCRGVSVQRSVCSVQRASWTGGRAHREQGEDQVQAVEHEEDPGGSLREVWGLPGDRTGTTHRKYMVPVFVFVAFSTSRTL